MTEWIITSSVLILVVVVLRTLLKGKISLRLQYALWALVLARLLIPGSPVSSAISVMNILPAQPILSAEAVPPALSAAPVTTVPPAEVTVPAAPVGSAPAVTLSPMESAPVIAPVPAPAVPETPVVIPWTSILRGAWIAGMAAMVLWLIIGNLRFYLRLIRSREIVKFAPPALYVTEGIETPCLFGLLNPSVYVTPEVAADREALVHVLAHEETHYHHKDHIWSCLRCICLVVHWYNPLVWLAAALSRRDSELACDEGAIRRLGEDQRTAYGRTLIGLTCTSMGGLLRTATTMTGSKQSIKERIVLIARKPRMRLYTLVAVILIAAIAAGCTFTGKAMDFPAWVSTITMEDLDDLVTGAEDSKVQLSSSGGSDIVYLDQEALEELMAILQGIQSEDFRTELPDGGGTEGSYTLSFITEKHGNSMKPDGWWDFTCIGNGQLKVSCWYKQFKSRYGFRDVQYLDCPELSKFIVKYSDPSRTEGEPIDPSPLWEDCARQMVTEHAAALTAELGRQVLPGGVQSVKLIRTVEVAEGAQVEICAVDYLLFHDLQGDSEEPVYGGVVRYDRYLFLLYQGDELILLGHMAGGTLSSVYGTPEMIGQYGDMHTAAAMVLYQSYLREQSAMPIGPDPDAIPEHPAAALKQLTQRGGNLTLGLYTREEGTRDTFPLSSWQINIISNCLTHYQWTLQTESLGWDWESKVTLQAADGGCRLIFCKGDTGVVRYEHNGSVLRWTASKDGRKSDDYLPVVREIYDAMEYGRALIFEAGSAQDAALKFVREVFNYHTRLNLTPGNVYRISNYEVKSWSIDEVSVDGNAVVGSVEYAFVPEGDILHFASGNLEEGTGDYAGWWIKSGQFLLERNPDGLWSCSGISTGGVMLELSGYKSADHTPTRGDAAAAAAEIAVGMDNVRYYAVFDLNHDGQDEIILETGTFELDRIYHFFAFINGEPVKIGEEYGTHSHLASDGADLIIAAGHMSVEDACRITWNDGVFRSERIICNRYVGTGDYTNWPIEVACHYFWSAIYGNPQVYRCRESDPQKAAETLIAAYVEDLTKPDALRTFTVTDYRNIAVSVVPTPEMSEADRDYNYALKDWEIGEDHWIVEFAMEYRWIGVLHDPPAGPGESLPEDMWFGQVGQGSPCGFLLTREGDEFVLRSRYYNRY